MNSNGGMGERGVNICRGMILKTLGKEIPKEGLLLTFVSKLVTLLRGVRRGDMGL